MDDKIRRFIAADAQQRRTAIPMASANHFAVGSVSQGVGGWHIHDDVDLVLSTEQQVEQQVALEKQGVELINLLSSLGSTRKQKRGFARTVESIKVCPAVLLLEAGYLSEDDCGDDAQASLSTGLISLLPKCEEPLQATLYTMVAGLSFGSDALWQKQNVELAVALMTLFHSRVRAARAALRERNAADGSLRESP